MKISIALLSVFMMILFSCGNKKIVPIDESGLPDTIVSVPGLLEENPKDGSLYALRAELFLQYKMPERALLDANMAVALSPKKVSPYIIKADILFSRGKVHESIEWLKKGRVVAANDIRPPLKLGEAFMFISDYKTSLLYLDTAAKIDDTNSEPWLIGGFSMMQAGDTANAIKYFNECLKRNKNDYKANLQLAIIYTRKLNPMAKEYYLNALTINHESAEAYYNMGKFHQDMGQYNEAIDAYITVTRFKDDMGFKDNAFFNLGYIHIQLEVYDAARDYFGYAIQANPSYYQAYYAKGWAHEKLGDLQNARAYYDKAIEMNPQYDAAHEALRRVQGLMRAPLN